MQDKGFRKKWIHKVKGSRGATRKSLEKRGSLKAAIGIEPMIKVLQTSALPLGYAAAQ